MGINNNVRVIAGVGIVIVVVIIVALWQNSLNNDVGPVTNTQPSASVVPSPSPSVIPSVEPSEPVIELPNRPSTPATLTIGCGGNFPTAYFRSTTKNGVHVICADSAGASHLTYVGLDKHTDATTVMKANYAYETDTFVAKNGKETVRINGLDGRVSFYQNGKLQRYENAIEVWQFPEYDDE